MPTNNYCTTCAHMVPGPAGPACTRDRSPVDGRPVTAGSRRMFDSQPCGPEGKQWEAQPDRDQVYTDILTDPAASYWLKTAIATVETRDPIGALADAEALADVLRTRADRMLGIAEN